MISQGKGKIINLSSIFGTVGAPSNVMDAIAYNTSKGAVEAFTKDLAVKWAKHQICVNTIAPSFIETDLTRETMEKGGKHILDLVPMRRFGLPRLEPQFLLSFSFLLLYEIRKVLNYPPLFLYYIFKQKSQVLMICSANRILPIN